MPVNDDGICFSLFLDKNDGAKEVVAVGLYLGAFVVFFVEVEELAGEVIDGSLVRVDVNADQTGLSVTPGQTDF